MEAVIAVIGMGYVGLPVALAFSEHYTVLGYDYNAKRVRELKDGWDRTNTVTSERLAASHLMFTDDKETLKQANVYIVCVPTPIDEAKKPDLSCVRSATHTVGSVLSKGDTIIYESTVYPGTTDEVCVPILAASSQLKPYEDFYLAFSPERLNPGDSERSLQHITKVVGAQDQATLTRVTELYSTIITAGVHPVSSVKVAEASKIIENTQRDLNIALINELAIIFERMRVDTHEVLQAAQTKWNFMPFKPGLVGGHCIGVDPYYLTYKSEQLGYYPEVILAGRRINDNMGKYVADMTIKRLIHQGWTIKNAKVAILGLTFKENCPDLRNSQVKAVYDELREYCVDVQVHDPIADPEEVYEHYHQRPVAMEELHDLAAVIIGSPHDYYIHLSYDDFSSKIKSGGCLVDVKGAIDAKAYQENGIVVWRL